MKRTHGEHLSRATAEKAQEQRISASPETGLATANVAIGGNGSSHIDWTVLDPANSRKYHNVESSIYILPEEEFEQRRLLLQNRILAMAFEGHILAPEIRQSPEQARVILDVGCANGIWLESDITLNPSEFGTVCRAKIVAGDVTKTLPYDDNTFDYVHQRALSLGIPKDKWPHVIAELVRVTKPGGWIELVEASVKSRDFGGETTKLFSDKMEMALRARGVDTDLAKTLPIYVSTCPGVENIGQTTVQIPIGWGGQIGDLCAYDTELALISGGDFFKKYLGISENEFHEKVSIAVREWTETKAYGEFIAIWAQKKHVLDD
ncbi:hypothetical protein HDU83_002624 [Entophlyctis luteolus]|nr:hypothetical protein HDU83_002624 [Entophlyctis luteolus]